MVKLLVETRTNAASRKHKKILECLKNYPEGATPKMIALATRININTVKSILPVMNGIEKKMRGLYKVYEGGDGCSLNPTDALQDWNFHNAVLSCQLTNFPAKLIQSTYSLGIINAEFILSSNGNATIRIAADNPLNVSSICIVYAYFKELISKYSDQIITEKDVYVKTIEFNKDYANLRLDGLNCITLDNLNEQFKIYQKKIGLRVEHKTKVDFNVHNIIEMLTSNPNNPEITKKVSDQGEQLERLTKATQMNTTLLYKLMDGQDDNNM